MPTKHSIATRNEAYLEYDLLSGLISKQVYDKLFDKQLAAKALERIKNADELQFITHDELRTRLVIKD